MRLAARQPENLLEHPGGANVLMADGAVLFLTDSTAWNVLQALCIRDDGQVVNFP